MIFHGTKGLHVHTLQGIRLPAVSARSAQPPLNYLAIKVDSSDHAAQTRSNRVIGWAVAVAAAEAGAEAGAHGKNYVL